MVTPRVELVLMPEITYHPLNSDFWRGQREDAPCWCCGHPTEWIYLDLGYQHPECDAYPEYTRTGGEGHFLRIRGVEYEVQR